MTQLNKAAMRDVSLTGKERTFREDAIIVSKTDPKGMLAVKSGLLRQEIDSFISALTV